MHTTKRIISVFIVSLFILGLIPTYVQVAKAGAVVYVDDDADPGWYDEDHVLTIAEAIINVSSGGTIYIWDGTYNENSLQLSSALTIIGNSTDTVLIDGGGSSNIFEIIFDNVTIQNINFTNCDYAVYASAYNEISCNDSAITGCYLYECSISFEDAEFDGSGLTINNNFIRGHNSTEGSIELNGISDINISDNYIIPLYTFETQTMGIMIWLNWNVTIYNNIIRGYYDGQCGIRLNQGDTFTVFNNNVTGCGTGIEIDDSGTSDSIIYNNYFNNSGTNKYNVYCPEDLSANNVSWNTTKTLGTNIIGGAYLGGNYWDNYAGADTNADGLGDTLTPYDNNGNITNSGDYLPLTSSSGTPSAYHPPVFGTPSPTNLSTGQPVYLTWSIPITDTGAIFNWTIQCNNSQQNSANGASNGTKSLSITGLAYLTTYKVYVNATDGTNTTRRWYQFTTLAMTTASYNITWKNTISISDYTVRLWRNGTTNQYYIANGDNGVAVYTSSNGYNFTFVDSDNPYADRGSFTVMGDGTYIYSVFYPITIPPFYYPTIHAYSYNGTALTSKGSKVIGTVPWSSTDVIRDMWVDTNKTIHIPRQPHGLTALTFDGSNFNYRTNITRGGYYTFVTGDPDDDSLLYVCRYTTPYPYDLFIELYQYNGVSYTYLCGKNITAYGDPYARITIRTLPGSSLFVVSMGSSGTYIYNYTGGNFTLVDSWGVHIAGGVDYYSDAVNLGGKWNIFMAEDLKGIVYYQWDATHSETTINNIDNGSWYRAVTYNNTFIYVCCMSQGLRIYQFASTTPTTTGLNITTDNATGVADTNATLQGTLNNDTGLPENTLYEHYDAGDNHSESFFGIYWTAQGFTPTTSHTLSMISLKLNKFGNPGILTVGVRLADAFGKPTGADLTSGTIDCSTFSTSYLWKNITLTPYYVSAGTTYVIVIRLAGGDFSNDVGMRMVFGSPTYAGGKWWMSLNSGSTWTFGGTSFDAMFREYNVSYGCITYFEWGTTTAYGNETVHTRNIAVTNVNQNLPGLSIDTIYHYRAVAHSNVTSTTAYGVDRSFRTSNSTPVLTLIINVYNESNGSQGIPFNMLIKNIAGTEVFQLLNQTNPLNFNTSNISGNQQIMIQIWSFGYRERVVILDIGNYVIMNLSFYLPRELMGAGADPGGGTGYSPNSTITPFIYYIRVVETIRTEYSEFDRAIYNANVNVRRFINSTGVYETMSTIKTDTNGFCNLWLIPGVNYLFNITATDFNTEWSDFIPAPPSNYQTTEVKTFRMTRTGSTGLAFNYTFLMQNITWSILPRTIKNKGAITFVFTITSSDNKLQWFNMQVHYYNNTKKTWVLYFTQNVTTAGGGTITYTTPNITGEWKVDVWFKKTGFRSYQLFQTGSLHFTIIYLPSWLDAIPDFVWYLVLIVLMIIIMGFCFVVLGAGLLTGYIGLGVFAFGLLMKPDLTVNGFSGWVIWSITFIIYTMGIFLWSRL